MYNKATFARSLKSLLEKRGMTQRTLAEKLETTEVTVLLPNRKVGSNVCHVLRLPLLAAASKTTFIKYIISEFLIRK